MKPSPKILLIEDDQSLALALKRILQRENYSVEIATDAMTGLALSKTSDCDVVVTDLQLPGAASADTSVGFDLVHQIHTARPQLPIILMTAYHTTETAIKAIRLGAFDYMLKPFEPTELLDTIDKAITSSQLHSEPVELGDTATTADAIIGNSRAMQAVYKDIGRLADKPVTVLVRGETGTGKELVARAVYQHSNRAAQPFIVVNCVAIPETLLESDLFGHEQGAFTGATARRIGRFEQANHGTIFLDEIGDMSLNTQAKLLRVLQEKTIQRLGGKEVIPVDVRIIAATHRDLEAAIEQKGFREDLYYRLNVAVIRVPPLRDRQEDIPDLVQYFLRRHGAELGSSSPAITLDAIELLQQQTWRGNVRELENATRKGLILAHGLTVGLENVREALAQAHPPLPTADQPLTAYVADLLQRASYGEFENVDGVLTEATERVLYAQAIELAKGNQVKVAKWLGVSRPTVRERLTLYGLFPKRDADS